MMSLRLISLLVLVSCGCGNESSKSKFKTSNLFLHKDSVYSDTLSVSLLEKYKFFNRQELSSILKKQTIGYEYGECGMGILDTKDQANKFLQFLSDKRSTLPDLNFDKIESIFAFPDEFNVSKEFDLKVLSTSVKVDTLSDMPNIIMTFAFFDQKSQDTVGYQWTKLYEWRKLGTMALLYRTQKDFEDMNKSIEVVTKAYSKK